jgi:hypothetical protein
MTIARKSQRKPEKFPEVEVSHRTIIQNLLSMYVPSAAMLCVIGSIFMGKQLNRTDTTDIFWENNRRRKTLWAFPT